MAALDFPTSPSVGQQYPSPAVAGVPVYTWDGEKWTTKGGAVGSTGAYNGTPAALGAGAAGASTEWSRGDHQHPSNYRDVAATSASADLNTLMMSGNYEVLGSPVNAPSDLGDNFCLVQVHRHSNMGNTYGIQFCTSMTLNPPRYWFRSFTGGGPTVWASWIRLDNPGTATTPPIGDNDFSIATTEFVKNGVALPASADFNAVDSPGTYYTVDSTPSNAPTVNWYYLQVFRYAPSNTNVGQIAMLAVTPCTLYFRSKVGGVWGAWRTVQDSTMLATTAEYANNTAGKILTTDKVWGIGTAVTLTDGATINVNFADGVNFFVTAGAAGRTLANPTNQKAGQAGIIVISNGANIGTWGSNYKFANGVKPTLSTGYDAISYYVHFSGFIICTATVNAS